MSKTGKVVISVVGGVLTIIAIVAMVLFIPINGKTNNYVWSETDVFKIEDIQTLEKQKDEDFKILLVTDLQLWSNSKDNKRALDIMDDMIVTEEPNLVVFLGDNVSGLGNKGLVKSLIKRMEEHKVPWAPVFGNHDTEGNATLNYQGDLFEAAEYCLFKKGPNNLYGVGNYVLNIVEDDKVVQSLYLFDNGRYGKTKYEDNRREVPISPEQTAWYKWNANGIKGTGDSYVPAMTFTHFAMPEIYKVYKDEKYWTEDEKGFKFIKPEFGSGAFREGVGHCPENKFFGVAKKYGLKSMFFGHDHANDVIVEYEGVTLTYGLKTGPSPRPWNDAVYYGGTVISIGDSVAIEHKESNK